MSLRICHCIGPHVKNYYISGSLDVMADPANSALSAVSDAASQLVTGGALRAAFTRDAGGKISYFVSCEKSTVRVLCITAVSLYEIYKATPLLARTIDGIVNRGMGGPRDDQGKNTSTAQ